MKKYRIRTDKHSTMAGTEYTLTDAKSKAAMMADKTGYRTEVYTVGEGLVVAQYNVNKGWRADKYNAVVVK